MHDTTNIETRFQSDNLALELRRLPFPHHPALRAWDAADEYLLAQAAERWPNIRWCIVNDAFGALTLSLAKQKPVLWYDSAVEADALADNATRNGLPIPQHLAQSEPLPSDIEGILLKLPRSSALLDWQLAQINLQLLAGTPVLLGGMLKHVTPADLAVLEARLDGVDASRIVKKARVWHATTSVRQELPNTQRVNVREPHVVLHHRPGVFSPKRLDPGAECLLGHLVDIDDKTKPDEAQIIDLCCGSGILGLAWLLRHPTHHLLATDASVAATTSAELTLKANLPATSQWTVRLADGLNGLTARSTDVILCNPPFHQADTVTTDVARHLFSQASTVIKPRGQVVVVGNRHLGYHQLLKNYFKQVRTVSQDKRFVVLVATQPKPSVIGHEAKSA